MCKRRKVGRAWLPSGALRERWTSGWCGLLPLPDSFAVEGEESLGREPLEDMRLWEDVHGHEMLKHAYVLMGGFGRRKLVMQV